MNQALPLLVRENLASWFRAKGFILVLVAALVPAGMTGAWVYTHQGDIAVTDIEWDPAGPEIGDTVNITATIENAFPRDAPGFDVLIRVGFYRQAGDELRWQGVFEETVRVDGLGSEEETQVQAQWTPGDRDLGTYLIEVHVDPEEELRESLTRNNFRFEQIQVHSPGVTSDEEAPPADGDTNGDGSEDNETGDLPEVDVRLVRLDHPPALFAQEPVNLTVVVENGGPDDLSGGTLNVLVERERVSGTFVDGQITGAEADWVEFRNESFPLDVEAGAEAEQEMTFTPSSVTRYRVHATVDVEDVARDPGGEDHAILRTFMVDRRNAFEEPPEGMTAKGFYQTYVLQLVHLKILIPLIALFYAAGVISDERRKNTLPYLFTRPVPRWALPVVRFVVSFVVAGAAVTVGILAANAILLGQPGAQAEFLYWPLGVTLGALFVYGAVFTLLGVATQRPYLWGVLYIMAVEGLVFLGRVFIINGRPFLQSWTEFLSIYHWFLQLFSGWDPFWVVGSWLDTTTASASLAGIGLAVIGIAALLGSAWLIQKQDFDV